MARNYDVIIVGGGIIGASIAYHINQTQPESRVCLLEQHQLTAGTTWHAAGLVAELRASANLTRLAKYSGELYDNLTAQGEATGFKRVGAVTLAKNAERAFELKKLAAMARHLGIDCQWLAPQALAERWPHLHIEDLVGGVYMPRDGQTNPVDTTLALARLARQGGVDVYEHTEVTRLVAEDGHILGVETNAGTLSTGEQADTTESHCSQSHGNFEPLMWQAKQVVVCAGLWSRALGLGVGANFPLYPAEHFYAVTEPVPASNELPIVRVPDDGIYLKPDAGRLLIGCFEQDAKPIAAEQLPQHQGFVELPFDLEHFAPYLAAGLQRVPAAEHTGIRTWFNGPESFTPDGRYLLGESPEVENLFVAAGFNSIGIQSAGGVGQVMAAWLQNKRAPMDLWEVDVRRFHQAQNQSQYLVSRTSESLGRLYAMHWPYFEYTSARDQRRSPVHEALAAQGACFGEVAGWERPNWYAEPGETPAYQYSYGKQNWFERSRLEHHAVRHEVALFDQTSFAKYLVEGKDACRYLNRLCTANVDVTPGKVVYCQWLNEDAGIEADITITRLQDDRYWIVSGAACATRDLHWLQRHACGYTVHLQDITNNYAVLGVMGPKARDHLQALTNTSLDNTEFPFATQQQLLLGNAPVNATRITYVGALGWELYVHNQHVADVYRSLTQTPVKHAGYHVMSSLRMEKAYRHWGHDITDEDTPLQAGLSFTVDWDKADGFIGDEALAQQKARGLDRRLVLFQLHDQNTLLTHDEPVWSGGQTVGHITSSAYSYQFDCSLGFAYVQGELGFSRQDTLNAEYQVEVADRLVQATPHLRAPYDPDNLDIR